jgi:UDP-N-acetylglucosamine 1-carboxyvinyltransferase
MGAYFTVEGGRTLSGTLTPQGAKNEALQIICATLLTSERVVISNIPRILDVMRLIELLQTIGVSVEELANDTFAFTAKDVSPDILLEDHCRAKVRGLRGSVMLLGPLLARFGKSYMVKPGGDKIGRRRIDTHILGLQKLGATFGYDSADEFFEVSAPQGLKGTFHLLDEASVTGTANLVMAAVLAEGTTTLYHAACEPYLQQLCRMLNRMGAKISGVGSNLLTIEGVKELGGTEHRLLADMIEVGSFIGMASMTRSALTIQNANVSELGIIPEVFQRLGIALEIKGDDIFVDGRELPVIDTYLDGSILTVSDHPWPGFTPDLLSVVLVTATQCQGTVLIHQKMFESRLFFVDKLLDMGAQIILCDPHRATVIGLGRSHALRAISMTSPDIRAGVALLIAALSAEGTSKIFNIEQIDRGYQNIDLRLNALGANIKRVAE